MLFRINYKNFLLHMIDYFTAEELESCQYAVISAAIAVYGSTKDNITKYHAIYPSSEITDKYLDGEADDDLVRRMFRAELDTLKERCFINFVKPVIEFHHNIIFICKEVEDIYVDVLTDYIEDEFGLPCIDLNELFLTGETELFRIDRRELHDRNVKFSRTIAKHELEGYESNDPGKLHLIENIMTEKQKVAKLKELGVKRLKPSDYDHLDELLMRVWLEKPPE